MDTPDFSSTSPTDIGRILAMSLDRSCKIDLISEQERSLLADAKVPIEHYHRERLVLAGFALDYAIVMLLTNSNIRNQARDGYLGTWLNMSKQSAAGMALYQLFIQRCPEYADAVARMKPGSINPIATAFYGFLLSDKGPNGSAAMLADMCAPSMYFTHFEVAAETLHLAGLISKPRDN